MKNRTFSSMPTYGEMERIKELTFDGTTEKSDREQAIEWWKDLNIHQQNQLYLTYFGCKATNQFPDEIEQIWRKETQQELERGIVITKEEISQVDFEMLKETIQIINEEFLFLSAFKDNMNLFFELLSKSSTFAHKAHKELKKLNTY